MGFELPVSTPCPLSLRSTRSPQRDRFRKRIYNPTPVTGIMASNTQEQPEDLQASQQASQTAEPDVPTAIAPGPEPRLPTRKDVSLREFLAKMDEYAPIVRTPLRASSPSPLPCPGANGNF